MSTHILLKWESPLGLELVLIVKASDLRILLVRRSDVNQITSFNGSFFLGGGRVIVIVIIENAKLS